MKDYYSLLAVSPGATSDEIRTAFLERAEHCHPDRMGGDKSRLVELCEGMEVLADPGMRVLYDRCRADPDNSAARGEWESASAEPLGRARRFAEQGADPRQWMALAAADVQKTRGGRMLAGFVAGILFGSLVAMGIGYFMNLRIGLCAAIGAGVGACAGAFGAASND